MDELLTLKKWNFNIMTRKIWSDEEIEIVLVLPACVAAQKIGIHIKSIRRAKKRFLQRIQNQLFNDRTPVPVQAELLQDKPLKTLIKPQEPLTLECINLVTKQSQPELLPLPAMTTNKLSSPKPKPTLKAIFAKFPNITQGQKQMVCDIFQYSPSSAYRYAKFVSRPNFTNEGNPRNKAGRPCN
jgi:hypothetical protein